MTITNYSSKSEAVLVLLGDPSLPDPIKLNNQYNPEDLLVIEKLKIALNTLTQYSFSYFNQHEKLFDYLTKKKPQFVFNLCDEGFNNDGSKELHIPAMLELLNIPYSGASPACMAICYNKAIVRMIALALDIPVPEENYYSRKQDAITYLGKFPALIKPNFGDGSIGITKDAVVNNSCELANYLQYLTATLNTPILIQEFLPGTEYSVAIIGNLGNYTMLPILEVNYHKLPKDLPPIQGYESKWDPNSAYWQNIKYQPSNLSNEAQLMLKHYCLKLFEHLDCRDYARFDFRADVNGTIKLLEVNPNPGWCFDGKLNIMASFANKTYPELLEAILVAAKIRLINNKNYEVCNGKST